MLNLINLNYFLSLAVCLLVILCYDLYKAWCHPSVNLFWLILYSVLLLMIEHFLHSLAVGGYIVHILVLLLQLVLHSKALTVGSSLAVHSSLAILTHALSFHINSLLVKA